MKKDEFEAYSIVKVAVIGADVKEVPFEGETLPLLEALEKGEVDTDEVNKIRVERGSRKTEYSLEEAEEVTVQDGDKIFVVITIVGGNH